MISWLYRYVFRGIGVLFIIGMITFLILAITSQVGRDKRESVPAAARR